MLTLTVERQGDVVRIVWTYPNDEGLAYAPAEELLRSHLGPLGYKLDEPPSKITRDGAPSYHHWTAVKGVVEPEPPALEAIRVIEGHRAFVNCVRFAPDGKTLASGAGSYGDPDNTVRVWDAVTGEQLHLFQGSSDRVASIAFTPDGTRLASVGSAICVWEVAAAKLLWESEMYAHHGIRAACVCYSPDGRTMACGCSDAVVRLWDAESGSHIRDLDGHRKGVKSVAFSPDGQFLASGSFDGTVRLWNVATGAAVHTFQGHDRDVVAVSYASDGATVASASEDRTVRIWDTATGQQCRVLEGHHAKVASVCYAPDGKTLASGASDAAIRVWDVETGKPLILLRGHTSEVCSLSFAPDGITLASGSLDHTIRLWSCSATGAVDTQPADEPSGTADDARMMTLADRISCGAAASISEFAASQEANARAQAQMDAAYAADSAHGVDVCLLQSTAVQKFRQYLLVNVGTRESLRAKHDAFNKGGLFRLLRDALPVADAGAIEPVTAHQNFSLPDMDLLPGDHLKPHVDAIRRHEYALIDVVPAENATQAVAAWKSKQQTSIQSVADAEKLFSAALAAAETEARADRSVPLRKLFLLDQFGEVVIAWSAPDDGTQFNSDRAKAILSKHFAAVGYRVKGGFVGADPHDRSCSCRFYMFERQTEQ